MQYLAIGLSLLFLQGLANKGFQYYDAGTPTSNGIERYVYMNEQQFAKEYMHFVQDSLQVYSIKSDDLSLYMQSDSVEMGRYYSPAEIIITNERKYIDYAVDSLSRFDRNTTISNRFVKGCVFHELTHLWIQQIMREMRYHNLIISPEYANIRIYIERTRGYGAEFIEEGICEYVAHGAGEIIYPDKVTPDFDTDWHGFDVKYLYAEYYVRHILDQEENLKEGIMKILMTAPPTREEIRNPELFYGRVIDNRMWSNEGQ